MAILDEVLEKAPEYYHRYIRRLGLNDPIVVMEEQLELIDEWAGEVKPDMYDYAYEEGKWTVKEVVGHILDVERVFGYRAFRFSRNDLTALAGFDQDQYVPAGRYPERSMESLLDEFYHLRHGNILLLKGLSEEQLEITAEANGQPMSVRSITYILPGHVAHHLEVLQERYL